MWDAESETTKESTLLSSHLSVNDDEDSDAPVVKKQSKKKKHRQTSSESEDEDDESNSDKDRAPKSAVIIWISYQHNPC